MHCKYWPSAAQIHPDSLLPTKREGGDPSVPQPNQKGSASVRSCSGRQRFRAAEIMFAHKAGIFGHHGLVHGWCGAQWESERCCRRLVA